jgi:membrane protein DedA with SNARE-associated domain
VYGDQGDQTVNVHHLVESYGYWAVFILVGLESFGVPLPGETALIAAATYAGATHRLSPWLIFLSAASAAIIGDTCGYWIGNKGGYRLLLRYGNVVRFDEPKVKVARYLFDNHGGKVVFFGRFVSVLRTYAAFLAGTTRMRYRRFLIFNVGGGLVWAAIYTALGYFFGSTLSKLSTPLDIALAAVAVAVIVVGVMLTRRHYAALLEKAEVAYPEPLSSR